MRYALFWHSGLRVCRKTFLFLHTILEKRLKNLKSSLLLHSLSPCMHGNTKRVPANTISFADSQQVIQFITTYAEAHAILLPGRIPGYKRSDLQLLPSSITKHNVWLLYCDSLKSVPTYRTVAYSTFCKMWQQMLPHIMVTKPMSDLCWVCQKNSIAIMRAANQPKEQESEVTNLPSNNIHVCHMSVRTYRVLCFQVFKEAENHITMERSYYRAVCDNTKQQVRNLFTENGVFSPPPPFASREPCSMLGIVHYSFDMAQQVHYPSNPLQPGPYFLTPRKCALFGVCCEAIPCQINCLIDEACNTGKGSNVIVSFRCMA